MARRFTSALFLSLPLLSAAGPLFGLAGCVEQSQDSAPSDEDVQAARAQNVLSTPPAPKLPSQGVLENKSGGKLTYLGADIDTTVVTPGQSFLVTHYWKVEEPVPGGWRLFVHLDGSTEKKAHMNADHVPVGGKYPVPAWQKGEIIRDAHKISLPPTWPSDKLLIYTGIWKGGSRFSVSAGKQDGQNRLLVAELPVRIAPPAPPPPPKRAVARKLPAGTTIQIDGKLDEAVWKDAEKLGPFVNTMDGSPAPQAASARMLWDDNNLYVAFEFEDSDIWSDFEKRDDKLWTQEAAELFIDADGDRASYIEVQVNPKNAIFDSWLPSYRGNDNAWDAPIKSAVSVNGTVNQRGDKDTGWTVEMAIPHSAVKGRLETMRNVPPTPGTEWRINLFRMDKPEGKPQQASGWSPPLVGDFHALHRFGVLAFADDKGVVPTPPPVAPAPTVAPPPGTIPPPGAPPAGPHPLPPALQGAVIAPEAKPAPADPKAAKPADDKAKPADAKAKPADEKAKPAAAKKAK